MKLIRISLHAQEQMRLRGATEAEVREVILSSPKQAAKRGKFQAQKSFPFGHPSPVNGRVYPFKTVRVIFADEPTAIVVVTVLVFYG